MALNDRLAQLQGLQVGNVENAIEDIGKIERQNEKHERDYYQCLKDYKGLLEEKLPMMIANISLLSEKISGLRQGSHSFYPFQLGTRTHRVNLDRRDLKSGFNLGVYCFMGYGADFNFSSSGDLKEILFSLYENSFERERNFLKKIKGLSQEYITKLKSSSITDFASRLSDLLIENTDNDNVTTSFSRNYCSTVPHLLNSVPKLLTMAAQEDLEESFRKTTILETKKSGIQSLDTSDFR